MLQLYERVMQSRNEMTLLFLVVIAIGVLAVWTALESVRLRVLQRMAVSLHNALGKKLFEAINRRHDRFSSVVRNAMLQDISVVREFVGGNLLVQLMDLCFAPLFVCVAFLFHPLLGVALLVLVMIVVGLTLIHQRLVRDPVRRAQTSAAHATDLGRSIIANAEPIRVMGMLPSLGVALARSADRNARLAVVGVVANGAGRRSPALCPPCPGPRHDDCWYPALS